MHSFLPSFLLLVWVFVRVREVKKIGVFYDYKVSKTHVIV